MPTYVYVYDCKCMYSCICLYLYFICRILYVISTTYNLNLALDRCKKIGEILESQFPVAAAQVSQLHFQFKEPMQRSKSTSSSSRSRPDRSPDRSPSLPSLRTLVRPTDWETVRSCVDEFLSRPQTENVRLPRMLGLCWSFLLVALVFPCICSSTNPKGR